ncbi:DNA-3-methyladenine glycosylase I [Galactobacter valiniphilus]|uniref:DNA-3-methyladenine glycosylase I n=1 Tax=Galactobacter valiniphilus TaxID=2676122 RepID=A0A399JM18_9MICC|nr:DNA-3-methyladenine glycosylase I [Galactobacter valiniphilus]RII43606.1 DNA-3-methyladenine glycosylase I [Galactobacter valiniphilus]
MADTIPTQQAQDRPVGAPAPGADTLGEDGVHRTPWGNGDALLREYYDHEWGVPVTTEAGLYERLTLEAFQSGLSWLTILRKREAFRAAFAGFDPEAVAGFGEADVERLMADAGIVRNRRKIDAAIQNAAATLELRADGGLAALIWHFRPETTPLPCTVAEVPSSSLESLALSKELKRRGFAFVGPTTMFALMEAVGIVDTHLLGSHRRGASGLWHADGTRAAEPRLG